MEKIFQKRKAASTAHGLFPLALGIGATTAIFSLLNAVMLQAMPVRIPQELVVLRWSAHNRPGARGGHVSGVLRSSATGHTG